MVFAWFCQHRRGSHNQARRTKPALHCAGFRISQLDMRKFTAFRFTFQRADLFSFSPGRRNKQLSIAVPSTSTVQAPHSPTQQPCLTLRSPCSQVVPKAAFWRGVKLKRHPVNDAFDGNCFAVIHCNFPRRGDGFANHFLVIVWMRCRRNSLLARHEERGATSCRTDSLMASSVCRFNGAFCAVCSACWQRIGVGAATPNAGRNSLKLPLSSRQQWRSQLLKYPLRRAWHI